MVGYRDVTDPAGESVELATAHHALLAALRASPDSDPGAPSRLAGWTIGHVLSHLARNADSHVALLAGETQYQDGWAGRRRDVDAGATRAWPEIVADLAGSIEALDHAYSRTVDWDRPAALLAGSQPAGFLPLARRREVELHWVDLAFGRELGDIPDDFVLRDLGLLQAWWTSKNRTTADALPASLDSLDRRSRWCWLVGRLEIDGLAPAALF